MKYCCTFIFLICFSLHATAANYYCSSTSQVVNTGDRLEDVRARCGAPNTEETKQLTTQTPVTLTHWSYTLIPFVDSKQADTKLLLVGVPVMVITFKNQKVVRIKKNDVLSTALGPISCAGSGMVSLGDSDFEVQLACGRPTLAYTENTLETITKPVKIWTYNYGPYQPQVIFQFENDQLTAIQTGQLGH